MPVGRYAVVYYGYKRTTGNMNLWLQPTNENKEKLLNVLKVYDFNPSDINHIAKLDKIH